LSPTTPPESKAARQARSFRFWYNLIMRQS
jgi:hypothetical protein